MPISIIVLLGAIISMYLFILAYNFKYTKYIREMDGMMVSMTVGMMSGLTLGTIVGSVCQGQPFLTTVISMLIGIVMGVLVGISFGLTAVLEGFISGLMGGMMGAMVGVMIPIEFQDKMIKIMLLLYVFCFILLIKLQLNKIVKHNQLHSSLLVYFVIIAFLISTTNLDSLEIPFLHCNDDVHIHETK